VNFIGFNLNASCHHHFCNCLFTRATLEIFCAEVYYLSSHNCRAKYLVVTGTISKANKNLPGYHVLLCAAQIYFLQRKSHIFPWPITTHHFRTTNCILFCWKKEPVMTWFEIFALPGCFAALIGTYQRFGTTYRVLFSRATQFQKTAWSLKVGPIGCLETSANNYWSKLRNIPEGRKSQTTAQAWNHEKCCFSLWVNFVPTVLSDWRILWNEITLRHTSVPMWYVLLFGTTWVLETHWSILGVQRL
jgi:hypothetical protein